MSKKDVAGVKYAHFPFRYAEGKEGNKFPNKLGYICISMDAEENVVIAGSNCSVSEDRFDVHKGIAIAKCRVNSKRESINRLSLALCDAKSFQVGALLDILKLRPTGKYMDKKTISETDRRWDRILLDEMQSKFENAIKSLELRS